MSAKNRRLLFSLALLIWAGVLLYFYGSGRIVKYLAPDFRVLALLGGLGLAILGLFNLLTAGQEADCGHDHEEPHDHESGDMHPLTAFLLMIVPLGLSVVWTRDEYSHGALARKGLYDAPSETKSPFLSSIFGPVTRADMEKSHPKNAAGFHEFTLMELFFSTGDTELQKAIEGMKVQTEGRWVKEKDSVTRKRIYRTFITCCAADSRAIPVILEFGKTPPELPENGWVKASGTMTFPTENGVLQPVLMVEQAVAAEAPYEESFMRQ